LITLREWRVGVVKTLRAGRVRVTVINDGTVTHELLVFRSDLPPTQYPVERTGRLREDAPGITKVSDGENLRPNESRDRTIDLSRPGTYLFVCNLPGHFKHGMYTVVAVTR
jgi:uncharacterized cupredoxin-like copper-binding protein